ncbi:diacylglycerol/lipid kinase family protein [Amnibacterium flavum]|nr:diacylglycerol kinase family protein [Amnibacterium flavum]
MEQSAADRRRVAIVINPSKFDDLDAMKDTIAGFSLHSGWAEPEWFGTAADDSGLAAAEQAVASEPDLVCVMGGDGTVRVVAGVLRGTGIPYGLLPSGTGNLLARNLAIPVDSLEDALEIAFRGQNRAIDVGVATFDDGEERPFVVMGGVGLDAQIMAGTDDNLKKKVGWGAYIAAAGPNLLKRPFGVTIAVDGEEQPQTNSIMVLACNCSSVMAGIEIATGAVLDDGQLDLVVLQPNVVAGWVGVAIDVASRNRNGLASLKQWAGAEFSFELDKPVLAELDGDPVGETTTGRFGVDVGALIVRLPVPASASAGLTPRTAKVKVDEPAPASLEESAGDVEPN